MKQSILHFNDCYIMDNLSALYQCSIDNNSFITFGGDFLGPSFISTFDKGEHLNTIFNLIGVKLGVLGNHEFDYRIDNLDNIIKKSKIEWLNTNVLLNTNNKNLLLYKIEVINNIKIGFIGLLNYDISLIKDYHNQNYIYILPYLESQIKFYINYLRKEYCEKIIIISHCGIKFDRELANTLDIDCILGGHTHIQCDEIINNTLVIHSGQDAHQTCLLIPKKEGFEKKWIIMKDYKKNEVIENIINIKKKIYNDKYNEILCKSDCEVILYDNVIRKEKSKIGSFMCKIIKDNCECDLSMINSGSIRGNNLIKKDENITIKTIINIFPFENYLIKCKMKVKYIKELLEYSYNDIENYNGKFMNIYGVNINDYDDEDYLKIITLDFLYDGGDGFYHFKKYSVKMELEPINYQLLMINYLKRSQMSCLLL